MIEQAMDEDATELNVDSDSQTGSRGYCIEVYAKPDGSFSVSGPIHKEEPPAEEGQSVESLPDALKLVLQTIKENPISGDPSAEMEAGYQAGPAGKKPMSYY